MPVPSAPSWLPEVILFPDKKQKTFQPAPQPPPTADTGQLILGLPSHPPCPRLPVLEVVTGAVRAGEGHSPPFPALTSPALPCPCPGYKGSWWMDLSMKGCIGNFWTDGVPANGTVTEDFQGLRTEVEVISKELALMDRQLCQLLLEGLERGLRDQLTLQALEEALEQGLSSGPVEPLGGPAGAVLDCLVLPSRMLVLELAIPVVYLLGALNTLSKAQHQLLVEAVELKTLSRQLELVGSVLEKSAPWQKRSTLSLPPELLKSGWGGETPAWVLLEECGLELREDPPHVHWDPQAQDRVCALYASLALLSELSQEPH
ncbi:hypothetical protein P7K49_026587 [Saguinus oedipus]|uniref:Gasdermin PUB domain-containing protein n=1 Tax=Saguinus oedipus TaxID=9490 RepID=A0ABQ9UDQ4_SAGOE|nr:hypothetical protein P7K49_026587 [Saguinus oedipus]